MEEGRFDYDKALERLEEIAAKAEDPATPLSETDACIEESARLIEQCRQYLRAVQADVDKIQKI